PADGAGGGVQSGGGVSGQDFHGLLLGDGPFVGGGPGLLADPIGAEAISAVVRQGPFVELGHVGECVVEGAVRAAAVVGVGGPVQQIVAGVFVGVHSDQVEHDGGGHGFGEVVDGIELASGHDVFNDVTD